MADRVLCKDCIHHDTDFWCVEDLCLAETRVDPVYGVVTDVVRCRARNKNFDCSAFERRVPLLRRLLRVKP